jgi:hypothetical protein
MRTTISAKPFVRSSPRRNRLVDRRQIPMRPLMLAMLMAFAAASDARAEPASTLGGLWHLLGSCSQSVGGPAGSVGSEVTVLFSIKRDGSLQGQPRITHSKLVGDEAAQKEFFAGALSSIARCFPLSITDGLGGAVAGRPLRLRVMNRARERGAERARRLCTLTHLS